MWSATERRNWFDDDAETIMHWREKPTGQHIELGIAETNLVGLIGELGAAWSRGASRCSPSVFSMTPSLDVLWNLGRSASTPVASRF